MSPLERLPSRKIGLAAALAAASITLALAPSPCRAQLRSSFSAVVDSVQPKIVKIYGASGIWLMLVLASFTVNFSFRIISRIACIAASELPRQQMTKSSA